MNKPAFSIITVTYNAAPTLERTIRSVLIQKKNHDVEYISIDGGSTDGTIELIASYGHELATTLCEPDQGIYDAMNKGIKQAKGEWIGIINGDDWYAPDALSRLQEVLDTNPDADIVVGAMVRVSEDCKSGVVLHPPDGLFSCSNANNHPATFVRKSVYEKIGLFDLRYAICADLEFILRAQSVPGINIVRCPTPLAYMRVGGASNGFKGVGEAFRIEQQHFGIGSALKIWLRKVFQKTRATLIQALMTEEAFTQLQQKWWSSRHTQSYLLAEEEVIF